MLTSDIEKRLTENLILETGEYDALVELSKRTIVTVPDSDKDIKEIISFCVDCSGKILSVTNNDSNFCNLKNEELIGFSIYDFQEKFEIIRLLINILENPKSPKHLKFKNHSYFITKQEFIPFKDHKTFFMLSVFLTAQNPVQLKNTAHSKFPSYFKEIFDLSPFAILILDQKNKIINCNKNFENLFQYNLDEIAGNTGEEILYTGKLETPDSIHDNSTDFKKIQKETVRKRKDGSLITVYLQANKFKIDENAHGRFIIYSDISSKKHSEEQIISSLLEKEILLKEIHHRVKNNLQIISSLLNFQVGYLKDKESIEMFKESQNRVKSIALLHEKLYQASDLSRVDYANYIRTLIMHIFNSAGIKRDKISIQINAENIFLSIDNAIPCGLIINELVTNSIKYAFPGDRKGEILIQVQYHQNNKFTLIIKDNGIGFPPDKDYKKTDSLGLKLVMLLINQMGAVIEMDSRNGTEFKIEFSILNYKDRI